MYKPTLWPRAALAASVSRDHIPLQRYRPEGREFLDRTPLNAPGATAIFGLMVAPRARAKRGRKLEARNAVPLDANLRLSEPASGKRPFWVPSTSATRGGIKCFDMRPIASAQSSVLPKPSILTTNQKDGACRMRQVLVLPGVPTNHHSGWDFGLARRTVVSRCLD